jgi:glucose-6-phosphate isomerase
MRLPALTSTAAYQALEIHAHDAREWQMRQLFQKDPGRFPRMTVDAAGLFLDYSKNRANDETINLLVHLARTRAPGAHARRGRAARCHVRRRENQYYRTP